MDNICQKQQSIFELAEVLGQQSNFDETLRVISLKLLSLFGTDVASVIMINPQTKNTVRTVFKELRGAGNGKYSLLQSNVIGWVSKNKRSFLTSDLRRDGRFKSYLFENSSVRSVMCTALSSGGVESGYVLVLNKRDTRVFAECELALLENLAAVIAPHLSQVQSLQKYFVRNRPDDELIARFQPFGLVGRSKSFVDLLHAIEAAARCDVRVLLQGQSGTGKELVARAIHQLSSRRNRPFVVIDCGAIADNLIESELFGHLKGAFTGATRARRGMIEEANGGTLFMDEIGSLGLDIQSKLLRVLQEGEVRAVGSNKIHRVDVRIISACSSPLTELVKQKKFREDLLYRLKVYPIEVPTLNSRHDDISLLANHFLAGISQSQNKDIESFHPMLLQFMQRRKWQGNIRELENFVEQMLTLASPHANTLGPELLPQEFKAEFKRVCDRPGPLQPSGNDASLHEKLQAYEEKLILEELEKNHWNQSRAARALKISERTIRYKMEKLNIQRPASP